MVVTREGLERAERTGGLIKAADVLIVVEIVSPGSHRMDTVVKHGEYADAGIPYYWIVDLDEPLSLVACHLELDLARLRP
ncbi:Uma2 family endonuclease [Amycolatopsis acidiphila]|uniref:Uma2 family endonuclease n=1 Tax=Amycolatopsis acidiphila TaxID=715473 RepID=UPI0027E52DE1|nr:Uma2 family endonuclease [Amycolatopsis acidiphila]